MKTKVNAMRAAGINFMHFRQLDNDDKPLPYGGATVAYKLEKDGIVYAVSRCRNDEETGKRDNFNRKVGAAISGGRVLKFINTHGKNTCALPSSCPDAETFRKVMTERMAAEYGLARDFQAKAPYIEFSAESKNGVPETFVKV